jgi:hypothetical protein
VTHKVGEAVIWKADRLFSFHEALPVEKGNRYSLIMFFSKPNVEERNIGKFIYIQLIGLLLIKVLPVYKILKYFKLRK